jgi:hypothetical protein
MQEIPDVSWYKRDRRWRADIEIDGDMLRFGGHATELAAAQARETSVSR